MKGRGGVGQLPTYYTPCFPFGENGVPLLLRNHIKNKVSGSRSEIDSGVGKTRGYGKEMSKRDSRVVVIWYTRVKGKSPRRRSLGVNPTTLSPKPSITLRNHF